MYIFSSKNYRCDKVNIEINFMSLKLLVFCVSERRLMLRKVSRLPTLKYFFFPVFDDVAKALPVPDRGKVVGGLPDVVTIMEKKVCVWR